MLDGLNQSREAEASLESSKLANKWLKEDDDEFVQRDRARTALYQTRLAAALLGLGDRKAALEMIQVGWGEVRNLGVTLGDIRQLCVAV